MIIDVHHHIIPSFPDTATLAAHAEFYYKAYGPGGRSERVGVSLEEVKRRFRSCSPDPDGDKLRQRMAEAGIDLTLMCLTDNVQSVPDDSVALAANRALAEFASHGKGKVIALAGIDPRRKEAPDLYRRCVEEYGMRGLKWHPDFGFYPNSEEAHAMLRVAEQLGTPLLTHTGPLPGLASGVRPRARYAYVGLLDEVAQD
ncbi:MAG: amidohydrolase family protein, partial [Dehalococcoidia bacterium]|nr:amidohydrolase family protein [Dehalococcoidia bacterium]